MLTFGLVISRVCGEDMHVACSSNRSAVTLFCTVIALYVLCCMSISGDVVPHVHTHIHGGAERDEERESGYFCGQ